MIHFKDFKTITELQDAKIPIQVIINIETFKYGDNPGCYYRIWYWA